MSNIKFPVTQLENSAFLVDVDLFIYATEVVAAAVYKYTNKFYIHQKTKENNLLEVVFESKDNQIVTEKVVKQFCNDLIDQQVRYNTEKQFGHIRNLIVEEAFKPVNK
ncbi:MAG: His-Xaa-Ser system protein HxsD [Paludibacteraceae bacterium]|nr:His-Xaa-Ser system protein HxsD [Paludibacteraceae bacterium]